MRPYSQIGKAVVLHTSGVGQVILAHMSPQERAQVMENYSYERFTGATVPTTDGFAAQLREIRERGWAADDAQYDPFVNCIAVPVRDGTGAVHKALSVTALRRAGGPRPAPGTAADDPDHRPHHLPRTRLEPMMPAPGPATPPRRRPRTTCP
ncbi:IclR family transcriptional regulator C-terminal domain-containing protein [Streptomyces sp. NPDC059740]|uniref:IclR family transcriptional regulator domain-containing protein n=1 Tax=Streptomyces sp. NPDC059740 TaxID=3346926 RepID=UPI0036645637